MAEVQRDEGGRVIAFGGLSLLPTGHRFHVGGQQRYSWCAWDTLFLPALLNQTDMRSTCPATGATVRLTVGPAGVLASEPKGLLVSFPPPGRTSTDDIVASFCCHVHFLAEQLHPRARSPQTAEKNRWTLGRPSSGR